MSQPRTDGARRVAGSRPDRPCGGAKTVAALLRQIENGLLCSGTVADHAEARAEALALTGHALGASRSELLAGLREPVNADRERAVVALVSRRASGEPTAYIIGRRWFYGLEFEVDPRVLVPRPETELLVERTLECIKSVQCPLVCDVGCGSGCVGIAVAARNPGAHVYAIDISDRCLDVTRSNARRHGVTDRMAFLLGDLFGPLSEKVHVVAANLPYIRTSDIDGLDRDVREHEPILALDGGPDGLDIVSRLLSECAPHVLPGGHVLLEVGWDQARSVSDMARVLLPGCNVSFHCGLAGIERVVEITCP